MRLSIVRAAALATFIGVYFILASISIIAFYLARTYKNGVARPVFVVDPEGSRM